MKEVVWYHADRVRPITDEKALWMDKKWKSETIISLQNVVRPVALIRSKNIAIHRLQTCITMQKAWLANLLKNAEGAGKDKAALVGHTDHSFTESRYQSAELENFLEIIDKF